MFRKKTVFYYILSQVIPTFILGIVIFIFIMLLFQFLKLTELILIHDVAISTILQLLASSAISLLPMIMPMSLLFAVLLTYSRLSTDSEIVALRALGYSPFFLSIPAVVFSVIIGVISAQTLFNLGPIAKLNFKELSGTIASQEVMSRIEAGTFAEKFFGLVLYTNTIDKDKNLMQDLFIFDSRNPKNPIAVVAKEGRITTDMNMLSQSTSILLSNGDMYKLGSESHTKVRFDTYNLSISSLTSKNSDEQDPDTYTLGELKRLLAKPDLPKAQYIKFESEYLGRWALATSCILFGFLGSALGSQTNRRSSASSGFIVSVICIILYWVLYVIANSLAGKMIAPPIVSLWMPNAVFLVLTIWAWRRQSRA